MSTNGLQEIQKMTGAAQTMSTWIRDILSIDEVPAPYQETFQQLFQNQVPFPYTVLAPAIKNQRNKPTEKLIFNIGQTLHVLEKRGRKIIPDTMPLNPPMDLEMGNALLYSWITMREAGQNSTPHSITIAFNAATIRHLEPFLFIIRPALKGNNPSTPQEKAQFQQALVPVDFKFNHFAQECLPVGRLVQCSLWQPAIRKKMMQLLGKTFYRNITLAHLAILTRQELILLWDDEQSIENRGVRYGGIRRFIPLPLIESLSVFGHGSDYCQLSIQLISGENIEQIFAAEQLERVQVFVKSFQENNNLK